jgi:HEXXH motif-containing protein
LVAELSAPPHHVLAPADFFHLTSGSGAAGVVSGFAETERSWRMVGLHHLITALEGGGSLGPLDPVGEAWRLLLRAEEADESVTTDVIMYPQVGIWISHLLRRLRGVVTDGRPLWADAGYLHTLAAAAAIRAGLDFTIRVPVQAGFVVLPTLGLARLDGAEADTATVRRSGGAASVSAGGRTVDLVADDPGWRRAPRCEAEVDDVRIAFVLDDVDPYRDLRGYSAPDPLGRADVDRWRHLLEEAWAILVRRDRARAESVAAALTAVIPLPAARRYRPLSASCDEAFAAIVASMPDDAEQLAVTLVHETQHVKLGALLHLVSFVDDTGGPLVYAPWRDDPRPLSGILQGIYAFVGITDYWRHRSDQVAEFEFALWRRQLDRVLTTLRDDPRLSGHGRELIANLAGTVSGWSGDPVSPEVSTLAAAAAADHAAQWRALHIAAPADWLAKAVRAWRAGEPCPPVDPGVTIDPVTDTSARWLDARAVLARVSLADPKKFAEIVQAPEEVAAHVPGALAADVALLRGDASAAVEGYRRQLAEDPADPRGWAGLGLARKESAAVLLHRPELVRALARESPAVDPLALAEWVAAASPPC